jgi:protein subunit release factor A
MLKDMNYDSAALRSRLIQRHGSDVGEIVFNAELNRRALQDARCAELSAEIARLDIEISTLSYTAGERQKPLQAGLEAIYAQYLKQCEEAATLASLAQAEITPLQNRSIELQQQLRTLVLPRLNEREVSDVAIYNSMSAEMQRKVPARNA